MLLDLLLQLLVDDGDGVEDETADGLLLLGVELGHFVDLEFEQREGVLYILDVLELLALHAGMEESDGIIITHHSYTRPIIITALLSLMSENLLPDIHVKIGKNEHSIHALNRHMRRKMNINKGDLIRRSLALKDNNYSQQYLVRLSFSNKTVVYKRRAPPIDRDREQDREKEKEAGQCHQSNRIVILKQSCRYDTEQEC